MRILIGIVIVLMASTILFATSKICDGIYEDTGWAGPGLSDSAHFSLAILAIALFIIIPFVIPVSVKNTQDEAKASIAEASAEIETVTCESTTTVEPVESAKRNTENDERLDEIEYHVDKTDDALNEITRKVEENTKRLDRIEEITEQYNSSNKKYEIKEDERGVPQKMFEDIDKIIFGEH